MRYHYEPNKKERSKYGVTYVCNHQVYKVCTLFKIGNNGLAVIQQRFNPKDKTTWWSELDPDIIDDIYLHPNFINYFKKRSGTCMDGFYPTVTVRQLMWALKMKPLKKEVWETCFDRKNV